MKTLEQLQSEHAKRVAELQRQHAVALALPVAPHMVTVQGSRAPWVTYKCPTLAEAIAIFRGLEIVPMHRWKGIFTSVCPESQLSEKDKGRLTHAGGPFACYVRVKNGERFGPNASLCFYAQTAAGPVYVHVEFGAGYLGTCAPLSCTFDEQRGGRRNEIVSHRAIRNTVAASLADSVIKWEMGEGDKETCAEFSYLFVADHDEQISGAEHSHALWQLVNMADILQI